MFVRCSLSSSTSLLKLLLVLKSNCYTGSRGWLKWRFVFSLDCRSSCDGLSWFSRFEEIFQERVLGTSCRECFGRWIRRRSSMEREGSSGILRETIGVFGVAVRYWRGTRGGRSTSSGSSSVCRTCPGMLGNGSVWIRHNSHKFASATQASHSLEMASIDWWIPWRHAYRYIPISVVASYASLQCIGSLKPRPSLHRIYDRQLQRPRFFPAVVDPVAMRAWVRGYVHEKSFDETLSNWPW